MFLSLHMLRKAPLYTYITLYNLAVNEDRHYVPLLLKKVKKNIIQIDKANLTQNEEDVECISYSYLTFPTVYQHFL